jgi:hypothetical protein
MDLKKLPYERISKDYVEAVADETEDMVNMAHSKLAQSMISKWN